MNTPDGVLPVAIKRVLVSGCHVKVVCLISQHNDFPICEVIIAERILFGILQVDMQLLNGREFDIDVIIAEDFEEYLNRENHKGVPVLWCYLRDLLFKQIKDKAVYGYKKKKEVEDEEYVEICGEQVLQMEVL